MSVVDRVLMAQMGRRGFLGVAGAGAAAVLLGTGACSREVAAAPPAALRAGDPFTLGVASGDPVADGVVLWTRLAPDPLAADGRGGMPPTPVAVDWEVATDEGMRSVVQRGTVVADPALGHSVHPEVGGLEPGREHFYRFRAGGAISPVGRTRTAPRPTDPVDRLRFAFASCQSWGDGFYTAWDHLAAEDLDLVVFLGDYIYENDLASKLKRPGPPPAPVAGEPVDLAGYRLRHSLYKGEAPLRAAHARFPWVAVFDDHEVENNWAGDVSQVDTEPDQDRAVFRARRAAAFQAYYENMPLRAAQMPAGPAMRLHRRLSFGSLAEFTMLDTRQYRDDQPCGDEEGVVCADAAAPGRTLLGTEQRQWLLDGFDRSTARWQVLGNQVTMQLTDSDPGPAAAVSPDSWDGYAAERNQLLGTAADRGVRNLVVITGDRHQNYAGDLVRDYTDPVSPVVGSEFVGTSITSNGDGEDLSADARALLAATPTLKFANTQRGYVSVTVTPQQWRSEFRVLPYVQRPGAPVSTRAAWVVEDGRPGVVSA